MSQSRAEIARIVIARAGDRCEYCKMHQCLQGATFHIEHIIPRSESGSDDLDNLCLACPSCNLHKSDRIAVPDPESGDLVALFHPRKNEWQNDFKWHGFELVGLTAIGRATILALQLNAERRIRIRQAEELFQLFPPGGSS